jgi:hypothetical protein
MFDDVPLAVFAARLPQTPERVMAAASFTERLDFRTLERLDPEGVAQTRHITEVTGRTTPQAEPRSAGPARQRPGGSRRTRPAQVHDARLCRVSSAPSASKLTSAERYPLDGLDAQVSNDVGNVAADASDAAYQRFRVEKMGPRPGRHHTVQLAGQAAVRPPV